MDETGIAPERGIHSAHALRSDTGGGVDSALRAVGRRAVGRESRLNYTAEQTAPLSDILAAANSRIKDVDVAAESAQFARWNILVQAGAAMLAQANAPSQAALRLLG